MENNYFKRFKSLLSESDQLHPLNEKLSNADVKQTEKELEDLSGTWNPKDDEKTDYDSAREIYKDLGKEFEKDSKLKIVNIPVKIDNNILFKVSDIINRVVTPKPTTINDLKKVLQMLSNPQTDNKLNTIEKKISIIFLLQYLSEIKNNFNPSSAGFLFESFIAGLTNANANDQPSSTGDNLVYDVKTGSGQKISIKFLEATASSIVGTSRKDWFNKERFSERPDIMLVARKNEEKISIYMMTADKFQKEALKKGGKEHLSLTQTEFANLGEFIGTLDIANTTISSHLNEVSDGLEEALTDTFDKLKEINQNVEDMLTGFSKGGTKLSEKPAKKGADLSKNLGQIDIPTLQKKLSGK